MSIFTANVQAVDQQFDARLGDQYVYGGDYSQVIMSQGCDCSYEVSWVIRGYLYGLNGFSWGTHPVSTESWPYTYDSSAPNGGIPAPPGSIGPYNTIAIASPGDEPPDSALLICIMHQGGGEDSHMNCLTGKGITPTPLPTPAGKIMESNGGPTSYPSGTGTCTNGTGGTPADSDIWTDWWYLPGPIMGNAVPQPVPPMPVTSYTVQPGDSMSYIAVRFGVSLTALLTANSGVTNPNYIFPGEVLTIP